MQENAKQEPAATWVASFSSKIDSLWCLRAETRILLSIHCPTAGGADVIARLANGESGFPITITDLDVSAAVPHVRPIWHPSADTHLQLMHLITRGPSLMLYLERFQHRNIRAQDRPAPARPTSAQKRCHVAVRRNTHRRHKRGINRLKTGMSPL